MILGGVTVEQKAAPIACAGAWRSRRKKDRFFAGSFGEDAGVSCDMEGGAGGGIGEDLGAGVDAQGDGGLVVAKDDVSAQEPSRVGGQTDISVVDARDDARFVGFGGAFGFLVEFGGRADSAKASGVGSAVFVCFAGGWALVFVVVGVGALELRVKVARSRETQAQQQEHG